MQTSRPGRSVHYRQRREPAPLARTCWRGRRRCESERDDFIAAGLFAAPAPGGPRSPARAAVFLRDVGHGLLEVGHNCWPWSACGRRRPALFAIGRPDVRDAIEARAWGWLQARHEAAAARTAALAEHGARPRRARCDPARHRVRPEGPEPRAGHRRALARAPLPRGARAGQPPGAGSLDRRRSAPTSTRR